MGRIVAVDYGTKRVGLAVTDPLKIIATALDTVHSKDVIAYLKNYNDKEGIELFVVGMPKTLSNEESSNAKFVKDFLNLLKKHFPDKQVVTIDERFTSSIALDTMIQGGMKKKDRQNKENVDKISAVIILQSYLEQRR
jgi:putative Holliday junction resolvase